MAEKHDHTSENNMSDTDNGCESSAMLSRRGFLKGVGALALGAVAAKSVIAPEIAEAAKQAKNNFTDAVNLAVSSKLYRQAISELRDLGISIDVRKGFNAETLLQSERTPQLVGIVTYAPEPSGDGRSSTGIVVTVDLEARAVFAVTYNVCWVEKDIQVIDSIVLQHNKQRDQKRYRVDPDAQARGQAVGTSKAGSIAALGDCACSGWSYYQPAQCCRYEQCVAPYYKCVGYAQYRSCSSGTDCETYRCIYFGCNN